MKRYVFLLYILAIFASANNADIDQILEENQTSISQSETSQEKVDNLSTEKDSLLAEWKVVVKQVEGLKIYNAQKRQQIKAQEERLVTLAEQTKQVVVIQRQIPPLMERMQIVWSSLYHLMLHSHWMKDISVSTKLEIPFQIQKLLPQNK